LVQYVGESERALPRGPSGICTARASSPCIIIFDKLDALVPRRDETLFSQN
jgi:ribosome biogenesis ATPase